MTRKKDGKMVPRNVMLSAVCLCMALVTGASFAGNDVSPKETFFRIDELSPETALKGYRFHLATVFGPTGLIGWMLNDNLIVREVDKGSPSDGVILPNDIVCSVNGKSFGEHPLKALGEQVIVSEETGVMTLEIIRGGKKQTVALKLQKMPSLAKSWPYDCEKSKQIINHAARYIASRQNPDGGFDEAQGVVYAMSGLVLLASDNPEYLQNARRLIPWISTEIKCKSRKGNPSWGSGYCGVFVAEYYLKTGDRSILPAAQEICDRIAELQDPRGGWTHEGPMGGTGYVQGGIMNPAGAGCWLGLELLEECGIHQKKSLDLARHNFMRFVDNGTLPYGDHLPEFNGSGNSKDELACLALYVKGEQKAAELFGRIVTDFPAQRCSGHTGGFLGYVWGNVAGLHNPHRPDYLRSLHYWNWLLHVGRRWDGGFLMPASVTGGPYTYYGPLLSSGVALPYGAPGKALRIFGKPKSVFSGEKLSKPLQKGMELYQKLQFDALRKLVKADTEQGKQLLHAADLKEKDIALSLKAARAALEGMNPVQAKSIAVTLDAMCDGQVAECKELIAKADSDTYKGVIQAAKTYEDNRWLTLTSPEGRKRIEKLASDKNAGIYQTFSSDLLNKAPDAAEWLYSCVYLLHKYWDFRESNDVAMAICKSLAIGQGGRWMQNHPRSWLRENGYIKDTFVDEWKAILPCSGLNDGKNAAEFAYYPVEPTKGGGFVSEPSANWMTAGFDDSKWNKATGPFLTGKNSQFKRAEGTKDDYFRIKFKLSDTDFSEWKLYVKRVGQPVPAVVFLNGKCVAWLEESPQNKKYDPVDLKQSALKCLVKGDNVLGIRTSGCNQDFDIGIYGKK